MLGPQGHFPDWISSMATTEELEKGMEKEHKSQLLHGKQECQASLRSTGKFLGTFTSLVQHVGEARGRLQPWLTLLLGQGGPHEDAK